MEQDSSLPLKSLEGEEPQTTKLDQSETGEGQGQRWCFHCSTTKLIMTAIGCVVVTVVVVSLVVFVPSDACCRGKDEGGNGIGNNKSDTRVISDLGGNVPVTVKDKENLNSINVGPLKVAAFNIKGFGRAKMSDATTANHIVDILTRYDVILVQEVRDKSGTSLNDLWSLLNNTASSWGMVSSSRIGRTSYKEQYVFFYRTGKVTFLGSFQTPDAPDIYEREPFSAEFSYFSMSRRERRSVVLMGLHSKPQDAVVELQQLPSDVMAAARHFPLADGVVAMGDFNADCSYVSSRTMPTLDIFKPPFRSLISDSADTTTGKTNCAYDRVVVYGDDVIARDGHVFNHQVELGLDLSQANDVSDHYPVEFKLH